MPESMVPPAALSWLAGFRNRDGIPVGAGS